MLSEEQAEVATEQGRGCRRAMWPSQGALGEVGQGGSYALHVGVINNEKGLLGRGEGAAGTG